LAFEHLQSSDDAWKWAGFVVTQKHSQSIRDLAKKDTRWHFGVMHGSERKLLDFQIKDMAIKMQQLVPDLWDMLGSYHKAHCGVSPDADWNVPKYVMCHARTRWYICL
jgi:hypothetical protein